MIFDGNNHAMFMLHDHLIICVKYRKPIIDDTISGDLQKIFEQICPHYKIRLEEWNHDRDHVHILFRANPDSELSRFIGTYKIALLR